MAARRRARVGCAMILQALGLKNQSQTGQAAMDAAAANQLEAASPEQTAELQLERDLAVVLARPPKFKPLSEDEEASGEDEDEMAFLGAEDWSELADHCDATGAATPEGCENNSVTETAAQDETAPENERPRAAKLSPSETRERWLKSTKRSRRSMLFRTAASFAITIVVTAFIVSVVAAILFGLPEGFDKLRVSASNSTTAVAQSANAEPSASAQPTKTSSDDAVPPPRMQWISFQGK